MAISAKRRAFINEYLRCWNASEAARRAGYSKKTSGAIGFEILKLPEIDEEIKRRVSENTMTADEVLVRLGEQARAEYADYIKDSGAVDLIKMKTDGKMHLIKSIKETQFGQQVEFYDAHTALVDIGKTHGLFKDVKEIAGPDGGAIPIVTLAPGQLAKLSGGDE